MDKKYVNPVFKAAANCADQIISQASPEIEKETSGLKSEWDRAAENRALIDPTLGEVSHITTKYGSTHLASDEDAPVTQNKIEVNISGDSISTDVVITATSESNDPNIRQERHQTGSVYIGENKRGDRKPREIINEPIFPEEATSPQPEPWTQSAVDSVKQEIDECIGNALQKPTTAPLPRP